MECQSFRQGCCGCCVNMRWRPERLAAYLAANTRAAEATWGGGRPRWRDLVRVHLARGGWRDHLLAVWLVPLTFGASAWLWRCRYGSCCFAGFLDRRIRNQMAKLVGAAETFDPLRIQAVLKEIVPEYTPSGVAAPA